MSAYCDGFAKVAGTASAIAGYINHHDISGVRATDASTVVFTLKQPANDFLNILALPFASPAPHEYLNYVPDDATFRRHTISDGPYQITAYVPNQHIELARNPAWDQASDPVRHQYVQNITVTEGQDEGPVQQQIQAGTADLQWDTVVPTANIPALQAAKDSRLGLYPGLDTNPYLLFNLQSPTGHGALANVKVRQALQYAIDKVAIGQVYGGPSINTPLDQVIPPGNIGYQQFDLYPTPDHHGAPATCKQMLAAAGYPAGFTLTDVYRNAGNHPAVAQTVQADLARCGIKVRLVPVNQGDYYGKYLGSPDAARRGVWDITEPGWVPDWYGNNGRAIIEPLFDGRTYGPNSVDYGDYDSPAVNSLIDRALRTADQQQAATAAKTRSGCTPRATSVATRRNAACSSAMRRNSARASALSIAVATSAVNRAIWASVSAPNGSSRVVEAATTPRSCRVTVIGQPTDDRIPAARASLAIVPLASAKLASRTGPPLRRTSRAMLDPSSGSRVPTGNPPSSRLHAATPITLPSGS